jgi:hypothetical protein
MWRRLRFVPLALGALSLALGLWTGLGRLGFPLPTAGLGSLPELHAAFMISGFLGTVISLERSVALGRWWSYSAPALSGLAALLLIAGMPADAAVAFLAAGAILVIVSAFVVARQPALFSVILAIAAICWPAGTLQWLSGSPMPAVTGWWLNFLVLTIAAERLELSRIISPSPASRIVFAIIVLLLLCGSARSELAKGSAPFTAAGLLGCSAWLLRYDIARRTIRFEGQARFAAVSILAGHVWLAVAGLLLLCMPPAAMAFSFDAAVHAITIGFVLSMIFGHAPIILPAVAGIRLRFSNIAYAPLAVLHASVILRLAGDLLEWTDLRAASAVVTIVALVGYIVCLASFSARVP